MTKVTRLGIGYNLWVNTAIGATAKLDDILAVLDSLTTDSTANIKKYFDSARNDKSLELAMFHLVP